MVSRIRTGTPGDDEQKPFDPLRAGIPGRSGVVPAPKGLAGRQRAMYFASASELQRVLALEFSPELISYGPRGGEGLLDPEGDPIGDAGDGADS